MSIKPEESKGEHTKDARTLYIEQLEKEAAVFPATPEVEVRYDFSYTLKLKQKQINQEIETVPNAFLQTALIPLRIAKAVSARVQGKTQGGVSEFHVLHKVSGVLRPGTVTLLLAPPGGGKTAFLKALAGRFPPSLLNGEIRYSGLTRPEMDKQGIHLKLLASYVDQLDVHLPYLTVRETAQFAYENGTVQPSVMGNEMLEKEAAGRVERVIKLLNLQGCADTIVGNDMLRGVSGGEKKRVTISEALVTNARLLCMDEISTGLDAAVTYDIVASIRAWAHIMKGTVVIALLQPTPEVYSLFDEVLMMREGCVVYHGPRQEVPAYMAGLGFHPPTPAAPATTEEPPHGSGAPLAREVSAPGGGAATGTVAQEDMADWLTELLTHPHKVYRKGLAERAAALGHHSASSALLGASGSLGHLPNSSSGNLERLDPEGSLPAPETPYPDELGPSSPKTPGPVTPLSAVVVTAAAASASQPPLTSAELAHAWKSSAMAQAQHASAPVAQGLALTSTFAKTQYGQSYPRSAATHFWYLLRRQIDITLRNKLFVTSRVASAIIISLILGSVWWQLPTDPSSAFNKFGMLLFCALQVSFGNFSEVPNAVENKYIAYKHIAAGMYPPLAYALVATVVHIPIALMETAVFSCVLYWMVGLVADAGRWFFFWLVMFLVDLAMGAMFRVFAYVLPDMEAAQTAPGPIISIQVVFAGFLIAYNHMGWLQFMYFLSIFSYALKSLALNEFTAPVYDVLIATNQTQLVAYLTANNTVASVQTACASGLLTCETERDYLLDSLSISHDLNWLWGGPVFLIGFFIVVTLLAGYGLATVRIERNIGTARAKAGEAAEGEASGAGASEGEAAAAAAAAAKPTWGSGFFKTSKSLGAASAHGPGSSPPAAKTAEAGGAAPVSASSVLPFEPMAVVWRDIHYTVFLPKNVGGGTKKLLHGVSGSAAPGRLLALMGASGAGKTTLLDVLAGRKNSGVQEGTILLNGFPKEQRSFARLTAYCEQSDVHNSFATVREALEFSAVLRLPSSVTSAQRAAFIEEVLDILELRAIQYRKVGEVGAADGLSPGQRKILTIGVELVSNAPIIFLDEPTSGLDSRAAALVMKVVRNIVARGRTVISTIHQPSSELFFLMDDLLLLQRGGYEVYFGPTGHHGRTLVRYMEAIPGAPRCPRKMNPASWMLDVLAGTDSSGEAPAKASPALAGASAATAPLPPTLALPPVPAKAAAPGGDPEEGGVKAGSSSLVVVVPAPEGLRAVKGVALDGPGLHARLFESKEWEAASKLIDAASTPAPGAKPYQFSSVYASSYATQMLALLGRTHRSYWRNVGYNFTRTTALLGLCIMFGTIWYKIQAVDEGGVQSLVSVIYMVSIFCGMMNMNTALPVIFRERAVFYRERFSFMYAPEPYALSFFLMELPWVAFISFVVITPLYFMVGFNPDPATYFFYVFCVWLVSLIFISLGQTAAAYLPSVDVAQAVVSLFIPLFFLFGGLFITEPQIPAGWKWAHWIDPITWTLEAIMPSQFYCVGVNCPQIQVYDSATGGVETVYTFDYVQNNYGTFYSNRWRDAGFLAVYIAGFQILHMLCVRYVSHIKR